MRRGLSFAFLLMVSGLLWAQETPAPNPPPPSSSESKADEQTTDTQKTEDGSTTTKKKRKRNKNPFSDLCIHVAGSPCYDVSKKKKPEETEQKGSEEKSQTMPASESVPRSDSGTEGEYSSSRDTLALSNEKESKPDADAESDVNELTHYDPHQAEKDIEVGEYYLKRKNYKGAINRFRSALENKPNYGLAIIRLAQALEPAGEIEEARTLYERYLKMLPNGEFAVEARKALERLQPREEKAATSPPAETPR